MRSVCPSATQVFMLFVLMAFFISPGKMHRVFGSERIAERLAGRGGYHKHDLHGDINEVMIARSFTRANLFTISMTEVFHLP